MSRCASREVLCGRLHRSLCAKVHWHCREVSYFKPARFENSVAAWSVTVATLHEPRWSPLAPVRRWSSVIAATLPTCRDGTHQGRWRDPRWFRAGPAMPSRMESCLDSSSAWRRGARHPQGWKHDGLAVGKTVSMRALLLSVPDCIAPGLQRTPDSISTPTTQITKATLEH